MPANEFNMHGDPFIICVGEFWDDLFHTRDYMAARYGYVKAILKVNTWDAVKIAHDHFLDFFRLCHSDSIGIRNKPPALIIRLGRDQECYDFIKRWQLIGDDEDYDGLDTSLSYLDLKDANILEPVNYLCTRFVQLGLVVAATLIKIRLLLKTKQALQSAATLRECRLLPAELVNNIQDLLMDSILGGRWAGMDATRRSRIVNTLSSQVDKLYFVVKKANAYFWPALLCPEDHLEACPGSFGKGSVEEMQITLQHAIHAWKESPGAFDIIMEKEEKGKDGGI